ncbi:hypothetical protein Rsub_06724 [Raphidocelis subcapitata]|uniref:Peptidase S9 prolyl oligopeptidase catalytic domain-containing protein n=1 Tax=Raphidocelis subcapitata TaxID=307507 RepID=A0A2V0P4V8_9CHLO|nr:hypothetical protein Rsub_06724 [Raphidocelis subcapitata]|eukprot:GBF94609.1 hypothetical protein Rsub_06724 [Raphidocelis subcapitata]
MQAAGLAATAAAARAAVLRDAARGRRRAPCDVVDRGEARPYAADGSGGAALEVQRVVIRTDDSPQGTVPCLLVRPAPGPSAPPPPRRRPPPCPAPGAPHSQCTGKAAGAGAGAGAAPSARRPAVVLIHASYSSKEAILPLLASYARRGYVAATIDNRYHGERAAELWGRNSSGTHSTASGTAAVGRNSSISSGSAAAAGRNNSSGTNSSTSVGSGSGSTNSSSGGGAGAPLAPASGADKGATYQAAIIAAWRGESEERPFLLDSVWDVLHLLDLLEAQPDVDAARIGMGGISLGGMITWLTAVADDRVAVATPAIGIQNWGWALANDAWQARLASVPRLGPAAAQDMGRAAPDADVAEAVLRKLLPELLDWYDTPLSLPALAPRPLLILNGELDARCPLDGVRAAVQDEQVAYSAARAPEGAFELRVFEGVGHEFTPAMADAAGAFFDEWL